MLADAHYEIGYSHNVCEDYALAGVNDDLAYAIVSDGCSSSEHTDVGARILAHITKDALLYLQDRKLLYDKAFMDSKFPSVFEEIILKKAIEVKQALHLGYPVFDATVLMAATIGDSQCVFYAKGDGHLAILYPDGRIKVTSISYSSNAPFYMSYDMSHDKERAYYQAFGEGETKDVNIHLIDPTQDEPVLLVEDESPLLKGAYFRIINASMKQGAPATDTVLGELHTLTPSALAVFSDGIETYEHDPKKTLPPKIEMPNFSACNIVQAMTEFKSTAGKFVHRRMNAVRKQCVKSNIIHQDDVSCAAIHF